MNLNQFFLQTLLVSALTSPGLAASNSPIVGTSAQSEEATAPSGELRKVVRVVDGDTIVVSPNEKVRLIGVDTPETVHPKKAVECFGKQAKQFTRDAVEGKSVRLVLDDKNQRTQHKDYRGRTLAYIYLEDGTMLNAELIRRGYGHAYTNYRFRYLVEFRELERAARAESLGLWSSCPIK